MNCRMNVALAIVAMGLAFSEARSSQPQIGSSPPSVVSIEPQPWQVRRATYERLVQRLRQGDVSVGKEYDAVLTEFDTKLFSRTPIEDLEILGDFYIPKDGIEKCLGPTVQFMVLGWYDALRFASDSGRAEISQNEGFFRLAFARGGDVAANNSLKYLTNNRARVDKQIADAMVIADKFRETPNYDRHWPTAYGLERFLCAQGGTCDKPKELPKEQWDSAWEQAKERVRRYLDVASPGANKPDASSEVKQP